LERGSIIRHETETADGRPGKEIVIFHLKDVRENKPYKKTASSTQVLWHKKAAARIQYALINDI